jgi:hypothetical protein
MPYDIFLSYAKENLPVAEKLQADLQSAGLSVWFDRVNLRPGEKWKVAISQAIRDSKYFLALLSTASIDKKGYVQREIREALDVLSEVPDNQVFFLPVRIDDCTPPNLSIRELQFVDLFPSYEEGLRKLRLFFIPTTAHTKGVTQDNSQVTAKITKRFGDNARQLLHGLAIDRQGNIVIVGDFWGNVDFGGNNLHSVADRDIFLAKFDKLGHHIWSKRFGDEHEQVGIGLAVDHAGAIALVGAFNGALDFGGGPLVSRGRYNLAVAKLAADGSHLWSKSFGDENYHVPECIAAIPSGGIIVAGRFQGLLDFGTISLRSQSQQTDIFVAVFSANGVCEFAKRLSGGFEQQSRSIAVDAHGNIAIVGVFKGDIAFDHLTLAEQTPTEYCGFLVKLDKSGNALWCKTLGELPAEQGSVVTFDDQNGDILAGGFIRNKLANYPSLNGSSLALLARYDASGVVKWSKTFGRYAFPDSLTVDPDGRILLTGHFMESVDFGKGPLTSAGGYDIFAALFSPEGNNLWSERFGDRWHQFLVQGAYGHQRSIVLAGSFHGTIDFGNGSMTASGYDGVKQGSEDVFLAILQT